MRQRKRGRVEHLPRNAHKPRVARVLEPEHPVAHYREAQRREVAANLVCAASVYANPQETRVCRLRLSRHARDGWLPIKRSVDESVRKLPLRDQMEIYALSCSPAILGAALKHDAAIPGADKAQIAQRVKILKSIYNAEQWQEFVAAYGAEQ